MSRIEELQERIRRLLPTARNCPPYRLDRDDLIHFQELLANPDLMATARTHTATLAEVPETTREVVLTRIEQKLNIIENR
ncbi:MAG: hypothetical protein WC841_00345 [Candidatus Shapirobacteria bacterium]|jgi:hypothetical protein